MNKYIPLNNPQRGHDIQEDLVHLSCMVPPHSQQEPENTILEGSTPNDQKYQNEKTHRRLNSKSSLN